MDENKTPSTPDTNSIKPIVTGPPVRKKSNPFNGLINDIITDDIPSIFEYIVKDVAIPTTVGCVQQSLHTFISMLFKMDPTSGYRPGGYYGGSDGWWNAQIKSDYGRYYRGDDHPVRPNSAPPWEKEQPGSRYSDSPMYDYLAYPFNDLCTAQNVLAQMRDWLSYYDAISIANFYQLVHYRYPDSWAINRSTLEDYGWFDLSNVTIGTKGGRRGIYYYITLPKAVYIK